MHNLTLFRKKLTKTRILAYSLIFVIMGTLLGIAAGIYVLWRGARFEDLKMLERYKPVLYTKIYSRDGVLLSIISAEKRIILDFEDIPKEFVNALVALEDKYFFDHIGVSPFGILAAAKDNLFSERPRGASTLTQQLVKNITKDKRMSYLRKLKEQFLAVQLERRFTKQEIFAMYANEVPFGNNLFGIEAAAKGYFGKSVGALSLAESATLAGIPQAPSRFNPFRNPDACLRKRNIVLDRMADEKYITDAQCRKAQGLPLELVERYSTTTRSAAEYFVDKVRNYLFDKYGEEVVRTSGWYVHTTLDMGYQREAENAMQEALKDIDKHLGYRHYDCPSVFHASEEQDPTPLETYFDPTWRTTLQEGLSVRGLVTGVTPELVTVKIKDQTFSLDADGCRWVSANLSDLSKFFKVGDVPLFKVMKNQAEEASAGKDGGEESAETSAGPDSTPPFRLELDQEPDVEAAFLVADTSNGDILAMVGGYDYRRSKFNRAEQAKRQVGSAFKPVIFGAALEQGYTLTDKLFDEPTLFADPNQFTLDENGEVRIIYANANQARRMRLGLIAKPKPYLPHNYYNSYVGQVTLRTAMAQSKNIVSVKLLNSVGYDHVLEYAYRLKLGHNQLHPFPSLALGAMEMSLSDLVYAFSAFAHNGVRYQPRFISLITDSKSHIIEDNPPKGEQVISPQNAYLVTTALRAVIGDEKGTARRARALQLQLNGNLAGKTGTTNDYTDGWFVGYSPKIVAGAWVGRDLKHTIGNRMVGSNTALPIWLKFFKAVKDDLKGESFVMPEGLIKVPVDRLTGKRITSDCDCDDQDLILEVFERGTEPIEICSRAERAKLKLPWYLQKRTYELDPETGEVKPAWVEIDVTSQERALRFLRSSENRGGFN